MKGIFVVLDGIADEPCYSLGQKTPLEVAKTPNLDWLSERGKLDYCYTVRKEFVPESNEGILSLLGYDAFSVSRGILEAFGLGIQLKNGDLAFRCNFATVDNLEDKNILDRRAGRTLTTKEAIILADAVNKEVKLPFKFEFYPSIQHRGVLVLRGGFSDNIGEVDAKEGKLVFAQALDEEDDSKLSADLVNMFVRKSFDVLDRHPVNLERVRKGLFAANAILCRGAGSEKPHLKKMRGKWIALGYMPLEKGIAKVSGMDVYKFAYPKLKKIDVYANLYSSLKKAIKYSRKMLKKFRKEYDYFYVHLKECDLPGHDNKPLDKVKMIELIDERFFGFLRGFIGGGVKLIVSADHTTACRMKNHTAGPVPVLTYPYPRKNIAKKKKNEGNRFTESDGLKGKEFIGKRVLAERMFGK